MREGIDWHVWSLNLQYLFRGGLQSALVLQAYDASGEAIKIINKAHITVKRWMSLRKVKLIMARNKFQKIFAQNMKNQGYR
jgi:hypothetical protein